MTDLAERYGAPSPGRRRVVTVLVAAVAVVFLAWLAWTAVFHASPLVESELTSYDVVDDGSASAVVSPSRWPRTWSRAVGSGRSRTTTPRSARSRSSRSTAATR